MFIKYYEDLIELLNISAKFFTPSYVSCVIILYSKILLLPQTRYNKSYSGNLETNRRIAWEENLITIYKHNMMAAAGHHSYTLRDNHIADLGTRQYIREMVRILRELS